MLLGYRWKRKAGEGLLLLVSGGVDARHIAQIFDMKLL